MPKFEALAENTKKKRKEMGETQLVFGMNCGVSKDEISNIENTVIDPKLSTMQNIDGIRKRYLKWQPSVH